MSTAHSNPRTSDFSEEVDLPLAGIRVLDLTRALSGPFCTALLGDLGADVVKVETPAGEVVRQWGPYQDDESLYFIAANRNKRSISIDIWSDAGRELLRSLVGNFDVVVQNFRPGVLDALGIGQDWMTEHHPNTIIASISGFGHVGPRAGEACFDQVAQGMGGLMSVTGSNETGPMRSGVPLSDMLTGMFAALGVCASLAGKTRGMAVHTSLLESVIAVLIFHGQRYLSLDEIPERVGNDHPVVVPCGVFPTSDGQINIVAGTDQQWIKLCSVLGADELASDPRYASPKMRYENKSELVREINNQLATKTSAEWLSLLASASVPCGPINDMQQTFDEPQVKALGIVEDVKHPTLGTIPIARGPLWIGGKPTSVRRVAPMLGEHTNEILAECGYTEEAIGSLRASGLIFSTATLD